MITNPFSTASYIFPSPVRPVRLNLESKSRARPSKRCNICVSVSSWPWSLPVVNGKFLYDLTTVEGGDFGLICYAAKVMQQDSCCMVSVMRQMLQFNQSQNCYRSLFVAWTMTLKKNKDKMVNESFGESSFYFIFSHSCIISVMRQMLHYWNWLLSHDWCWTNFKSTPSNSSSASRKKSQRVILHLCAWLTTFCWKFNPTEEVQGKNVVKSGKLCAKQTHAHTHTSPQETRFVFLHNKSIHRRRTPRRRSRERWVRSSWYGFVWSSSRRSSVVTIRPGTSDHRRARPLAATPYLPGMSNCFYL